MAYNPSAKARSAESIGKQYDRDQVIIITIDQEKGCIEYASWGKTRDKCAEARVLADKAYDAIMGHFHNSAT